MAPHAGMLSPTEIVYPDSDGKPIADNTKQAHWIMLIYQNLAALFADDPNVFIAADNLIYPVEGGGPGTPGSRCLRRLRTSQR